MITQESIISILRGEYNYEVDEVFDLEEFKKAFKYFHKFLSGQKNCNMKYRWKLTERYINLRDSSNGKIRALGDVARIR